MANELAYQRELMKKIRKRIPGCKTFKNDPTQEQGIPDILILHNRTWGMLEVKMSPNAAFEPNQLYHIDRYNEMSFAAVIHPGNEEEVLDALQQALGADGPARVPQS